MTESCLEETRGELKIRTLDQSEDVLPRYREFLNQLHPLGILSILVSVPVTG